MFDNQRYLSKGVDSRVSKFTQILMWEMIDEMNVEKDHLQIFNLIPIEVDGERVQKIIHTQEQPPYGYFVNWSDWYVDDFVAQDKKIAAEASARENADAEIHDELSKKLPFKYVEPENESETLNVGDFLDDGEYSGCFYIDGLAEIWEENDWGDLPIEYDGGVNGTLSVRSFETEGEGIVYKIYQTFTTDIEPFKKLVRYGIDNESEDSVTWFDWHFDDFVEQNNKIAEIENNVAKNVAKFATSGTFANGDDIFEYKLYEWGLLTISGSGDMPNFTSLSSVPWYNYRNDVRALTISDNVTHIGDYAFMGCVNLTSVTIPKSVNIFQILILNYK